MFISRSAWMKVRFCHSLDSISQLSSRSDFEYSKSKFSDVRCVGHHSLSSLSEMPSSISQISSRFIWSWYGLSLLYRNEHCYFTLLCVHLPDSLQLILALAIIYALLSFHHSQRKKIQLGCCIEMGLHCLSYIFVPRRVYCKVLRHVNAIASVWLV
jgi:hypothetical protein